MHFEFIRQNLAKVIEEGIHNQIEIDVQRNSFTRFYFNDSVVRSLSKLSSAIIYSHDYHEYRQPDKITIYLYLDTESVDQDNHRQIKQYVENDTRLILVEKVVEHNHFLNAKSYYD